MAFEKLPKSLIKDLIELKGYQLQRECAPKLRELVFKHAKTSKKSFATYMRSSGSWKLLGQNAKGEDIYTTSFKEFLREYEKEGKPASNQVAMLVGEWLEVNIDVTVKHKVTRKKESYRLYTYDENPLAPTIHFYNDNDDHWYASKDELTLTYNDNCFFYALTQELSRLLTGKAQPVEVVVSEVKNITTSSTSTLKEETFVEKQKEISTPLPKAEEILQNKISTESPVKIHPSDQMVEGEIRNQESNPSVSLEPDLPKQEEAQKVAEQKIEFSISPPELQVGLNNKNISQAKPIEAVETEETYESTSHPAPSFNPEVELSKEGIEEIEAHQQKIQKDIEELILQRAESNAQIEIHNETVSYPIAGPKALSDSDKKGSQSQKDEDYELALRLAKAEMDLEKQKMELDQQTSGDFDLAYALDLEEKEAQKLHQQQQIKQDEQLAKKFQCYDNSGYNPNSWCAFFGSKHRAELLQLCDEAQEQGIAAPAA